MVVTNNSNMSDESNDEVDMDLSMEMQQYRSKYELLLERCEIIQQDNERIVHRIQRMKKMTKLYKKEIKFIMQRLDYHGDEWRTAQMDVEFKPFDMKVKENEFQTPKIEKHPSGKTPLTSVATIKKKAVPKKKIKTEKIEKDPNAPKRPANPFFQFCQEQRPLAMQRLSTGLTSGQPEPNKQELTKQLAQQWRSLNVQDKQIYVDMYERSKEKYAEEMSVYIKKE